MTLHYYFKAKQWQNAVQLYIHQLCTNKNKHSIHKCMINFPPTTIYWVLISQRLTYLLNLLSVWCDDSNFRILDFWAPSVQHLPHIVYHSRYL